MSDEQDKVDRATRRAINKRANEEIRRDKISRTKTLQRLDQAEEMVIEAESSLELNKAVAIANIQFGKLRKIMPDMKAVEHTTDDSLTVVIRRKKFDGSQDDTDNVSD